MNVKKTVLSVEDEEVNRLLLEKILGSQYSTIEAVDGIDGLNKLEENAGKIDIVLLDLVMPRMGGYEFLEKKAHISKIASVPVIVVTQSDREEDVHESEAVRLHSVTMAPGASAIGRALGDIGCAGLGVTVSSVRRRNIRALEPSDELRFQEGDVVVLLGRPDGLAVVEERLLKG